MSFWRERLPNRVYRVVPQTTTPELTTETKSERFFFMHLPNEVFDQLDIR